jgi:peptidoglycan/xylan/chitin deacetylase (PgdA/CDA1 family)
MRARMRNPLRPLVLCYHAVSDGWDDPLAVSPGAFERQLQGVLARGYRPVGAAEVVAGNGRLVHVTFDDAFRSVATALPALERLSVPATVFACPGFSDGECVFDVPELAGQLPQNSEHLATMSWAELRDLVDRGVEVGSHTVTHPHLPKLDDHELLRELRESRERLEDELAVPCRFLAYPYGDEDERVHAAARSSGYEAAFALPGKQASDNRYAVPRVGIWRTDGLGRVALKTSAVVRRLLLDRSHPFENDGGLFGGGARAAVYSRTRRRKGRGPNAPPTSAPE